MRLLLVDSFCVSCCTWTVFGESISGACFLVGTPAFFFCGRGLRLRTTVIGAGVVDERRRRDSAAPGSMPTFTTTTHGSKT